MKSRSSTTSRCLGLVATAFIRPDGGRRNLPAKTLATLWYLLVLPDAQSRLHRQLRHKRQPWYSASRLLGVATAAANILTMPLSWGLLAANRRNASRLAALAVLLNPPSIQLSLLLISEISSACLHRTLAIARGLRTIVIRPFRKTPPGRVSPPPPPSPPRKQD